MRETKQECRFGSETLVRLYKGSKYGLLLSSRYYGQILRSLKHEQLKNFQSLLPTVTDEGGKFAATVSDQILYLNHRVEC